MRILSKAIVAASLLTGAAVAQDDADRGSDVIIGGLTLSSQGLSTALHVDQRDFMRLERGDMKRLAAPSNPDRGVVIEGFSPAMSAHLARMAVVERARTFALIRHLHGLKDASERQALLAQESTSGPQAYQDGLAFWRNHPLEGRLLN